MQKMQDGYDKGIEVVLGYSPYKKGPGVLNKIIRFDTFHTALQYLSYALAGIPYMGVGRNLSYKKDVFLRNKGFSAINHVPGGDDDLFINKVATRENTAIVVDPDTFTVSEPKKTFGEWYRQKSRHYSTAKYYKPLHKFLLGLYSFTHILFYPLLITSLFFNWRVALSLFGARLIVQGITFHKTMRRLGEGRSLPLVVAAGYLDVPVLPNLFFHYMANTPAQLEIVLQYFADFSPVQLQQLAALEDLYKEWNAKINVISRKDIDSLYEKHVLHSLAIAAAFEFTPDMEVIDIGTGGGFPGIPLAIFFPQTRFHLVDSIGKKIKVVEAVSAGAGLTNITTQHGRAEEIKNRKFDVAISRAVAPLGELWTWAKFPPLLRKPKTRPHAGPAGDAHPTSTASAPDAPSPADAPTPTPIPSGLICLKGGDLAAEISASGTRPKVMEINDIFPQEYFREKYLLHVPY